MKIKNPPDAFVEVYRDGRVSPILNNELSSTRNQVALFEVVKGIVERDKSKYQEKAPGLYRFTITNYSLGLFRTKYNLTAV